jgi:hypothetical protein
MNGNVCAHYLKAMERDGELVPGGAEAIARRWPHEMQSFDRLESVLAHPAARAFHMPPSAERQGEHPVMTALRRMPIDPAQREALFNAWAGELADAVQTRPDGGADLSRVAARLARKLGERENWHNLTDEARPNPLAFHGAMELRDVVKRLRDRGMVAHSTDVNALVEENRDVASHATRDPNHAAKVLVTRLRIGGRLEREPQPGDLHFPAKPAPSAAELARDPRYAGMPRL